MGDTVENNFLRRGLGPLNRVLSGVAVQQDVHFRHFGNPTAIDLAVKLDRELHSRRLPDATSRYANIWRDAYACGCGPELNIWGACPTLR
jgi:hypothetical protein